ncbi:HNH endonuclease [Citrobacter portucalensis]|uniref:HNH endonuclease n=1 Tax=Citrobacter portucalensis TaxID=1639133 RepID=UPI001910783F|nr:HNH endonuclease [Citrobacter portucalensis]
MNCLSCLNPLDQEEIRKLAIPSGVAICDHCASTISESYNAWHGGAQYAPIRPKVPRKNISPTVRLRIFQRDKYRCKQCGISDDLTIDHIRPVSKGGGNEDENLQTLCRSCNSRKGVSWAV